MPNFGRIEYDAGDPAGVLKQLLKAAKVGVEAAAAKWAEDIAPEHFKPDASDKYRYAPRSAAYLKRKRRRFGHQLPLVFTGQSRRAVKQGATIRSRRLGDSVIEGAAGFPALPKYFYQYRKDHDAPDKAAELTRTTPDEDRLLAIIVETMTAKEVFVRGGASRRIKRAS